MQMFINPNPTYKIIKFFDIRFCTFRLSFGIIIVLEINDTELP